MSGSDMRAYAKSCPPSPNGRQLGAFSPYSEWHTFCACGQEALCSSCMTRHVVTRCHPHLGFVIPFCGDAVMDAPCAHIPGEGARGPVRGAVPHPDRASGECGSAEGDLAGCAENGEPVLGASRARKRGARGLHATMIRFISIPSPLSLPSSSGPGRRPLTAKTGVRVP
jgi:hypothetical protein